MEKKPGKNGKKKKVSTEKGILVLAASAFFILFGTFMFMVFSGREEGIVNVVIGMIIFVIGTMISAAFVNRKRR
jgi:hypothetical protein